MARARLAKRSMRRAIALTMASVLYGNLVNLLPHTLHAPAYVPLNVAAGAIAGVMAWRWFRLDRERAGLPKESVRPGLRWGIGIGLAIAAPLYLALLTPWTRELLAGDMRHAHLTPIGLLYTALVRIPIGTALFEEWLFRGVLFAVWLRLAGMRAAFIVPSVTFGLWHIMPTLDLLVAARPSIHPTLVGPFILGAVLATATSGILFTLLRTHTRGILGPTLAHALINSLALISARLARGGA